MSAEALGWQPDKRPDPDLNRALGAHAILPLHEHEYPKPSLVVYEGPETRAQNDFFDFARIQGINPELTDHRQRPAYASTLHKFIYERSGLTFAKDKKKYEAADPVDRKSLPKPVMPVSEGLVERKLQDYYGSVQIGSTHQSHLAAIQRVRQLFRPLVDQFQPATPELQLLAKIREKLARQPAYAISLEAVLDLTTAYGMTIEHIQTVRLNQQRDALLQHRPQLNIE